MPAELLIGSEAPVYFADADEIRQFAEALGIDPQADMIPYRNSGQLVCFQ